MDLQLQDQVILVLGGNGTIGADVVNVLKSEGAIPLVASRSSELSIDASDEASVRAGIEKVVTEYGRLDGLVVSSAPAAQTLDPAKADDPEQVLTAIDGKAMTFLRTANIALDVMKKQGYGRIIALSGKNSYVTDSTTASARNATLNVIVKNLADQNAGSGITVNAISPGFVIEDPNAGIDRADGQTSLREVADTIVFLLSPKMESISGEIISVGHKAKGVILP
ncbi:SDR family NAD(P)-dependent oxidoreductase [Corynebacterium stationis]|uniref:SDR family NAD(P)-dependent oxidoreductase n=2 Tax=Corynebacterium stationis TaxID=1705 RepID=UPI00242F2F7C|nr:SDR family oxidoreductase [Corynebacterium stationis]WLP87570.1 SDR family oxidoreductase [Corynebacterium stationis]